MCDSDKASREYFAKHIEHMRESGQNTDYTEAKDIKDFFDKIN